MKPTWMMRHLATTERRLPSQWIFWDEICDDVVAYFDEAELPSWNIDDDVFGVQGLAINFFFPLRTDRHGLSRLIGLLCGRHLTVEAFELICRGRTGTDHPLIDIVARLREGGSSESVLLIKCMPPMVHRGSAGVVGGECPADPGPPASSTSEPVCDGRVPELARGQRVADDLERQGAADRVMFAVVYDNRDLSFADLCSFWHHTRVVQGCFHAWTYQQLLAIAASTMAGVPDWRTFLSERYGITAIGVRSAEATPFTALADERRSA